MANERGQGGFRGREDYEDRRYRQQGSDYERNRWQQDQGGGSDYYRQQNSDYGQGGRDYGGRQYGGDYGGRRYGGDYGSRSGEQGREWGGSRSGSGQMGGWQSYDDDYAPAGAYAGQDTGYGGNQGAGYGSGLTGSRSAYGGRDEWTDQSDFSNRRGRWSGRGGYGDRMYGDRYYGGSSGGSYGGRSGQGSRDFWDRASDEVSSWFGDEDAERRRRMDQHRGRGPKNYARSDDRIKEDVNDRLTDDGFLDATDIDVEVSNREVTLSGEVDSRMAKRRAEDIAESVSSVTHVQNNLRVKQEGNGSSSYTGSSATGTGSTSTVRRTSST